MYTDPPPPPTGNFLKKALVRNEQVAKAGCEQVAKAGCEQVAKACVTVPKSQPTKRNIGVAIDFIHLNIIHRRSRKHL